MESNGQKSQNAQIQQCSFLQCQKQKKEFVFEVYEDTGNDSIKHFSVKLFLNGELAAKGRATSKKKAEETAAKRAYFVFQKEFSNL